MCKLIINFLIRNTWIYHKMVVTVSVKVGFFILISYFVKKTNGPLIFHSHWGCLNNPIFWNLGSCAACWAQFMYHHKLWPTSVGHPFSFLNSSLGLTGGKNYPKITVHIFRLVLQNFAFPGSFLYISFHSYLLSWLPSGWFVIAVCGSISVRELVK